MTIHKTITFYEFLWQKRLHIKIVVNIFNHKSCPSRIKKIKLLENIHYAFFNLREITTDLSI